MTDTLLDSMQAYYAAQLGHQGSVIELEREYFQAATNETWADAALSFYAESNGSNPIGTLNDEIFKYYSQRSGLSPAASYSIADHMYALFGSGGGHAVTPPITDQLEAFFDAGAIDGFSTDARISKNKVTINQASIETDTSGLSVYSNSTVARSTAQALHGSASLAITSVAGGAMSAGFTPPATVVATAGTTYTATMWTRAATVARNITPQMTFRDSSQATVGSTFSGTSTANTTTGWTQHTVTGVAPVNTAFVLVHLSTSATAGAGEVHYADQWGFWEGSSTDWVLPGKLHNVNILTYNQATIETDTTGLVARGGSPTLARSTAIALHGVANLSVTLTANGASGWGCQAASGVNGLLGARVTPGKTYTAVTYVRMSTAVTRSMTQNLVWNDSIGNQISAVTSSAISVTNTGWVALVATGVAPANAVYGAPAPGISDGIIADVIYSDEFGIWEGSQTEWVPPYRGSTLQDGSPVEFWRDISGKNRHLSQTGADSLKPLYRKPSSGVISKNLCTANQASAETDTTGWNTAAFCTMARSTLFAAHGSASIEFTSSGAGAVQGGSAFGTSGMPVIAGRTYTFVVSAYAPSITATADIVVIWYDSAGSVTGVGTLLSPSQALSAGWKQFTVTGVAGVGAAYGNLRIRWTAVGASEKVYLDKMGYWEGSSTDWIFPGIQYPNLLTFNQASVETDTTGFVNQNNVTFARDTSQFTHGVASLRTTAIGATNTSFSPSTGTTTPNAVAAPGEVFTATCKVKSAVTPRSMSMSLYWLNAANGVITNTPGTGVLTSTSAWTQLVVTATAPALTAGVLVVISEGSIAAGEQHYFDELGLWRGSDVVWEPPVSIPNSKPTTQWAQGQSAALQTLIGNASQSPTATTIYVVCMLDGLGYSHTPVLFRLAGAAYVGAASAGPFGRPATVWGSSILNSNVPTSNAVLSFKFGAATEVRSNGGAASSGAAASGAATATWMMGSGSPTAGGSIWPGTIAAVLIYSKEHTDTERQQIERWLGARFGVTVA